MCNYCGQLGNIKNAISCRFPYKKETMEKSFGGVPVPLSVLQKYNINHNAFSSEPDRQK